MKAASAAVDQRVAFRSGKSLRKVVDLFIRRLR
jgi:hypothetical protein